MSRVVDSVEYKGEKYAPGDEETLRAILAEQAADLGRAESYTRVYKLEYAPGDVVDFRPGVSRKVPNDGKRYTATERARIFVF